MKKFLKDNWFIITFLVAPLMTGLVFLFSLSTRIYDSPAQKVKHDNHMENTLTPNQEFQDHYQDSIFKDTYIRDKESAIKKRKTTLKNDSIERLRSKKQDSTILDYVQKNADQIYQMKEKLNN